MTLIGLLPRPDILQPPPSHLPLESLLLPPTIAGRPFRRPCFKLVYKNS